MPRETTKKSKPAPRGIRWRLVLGALVLMLVGVSTAIAAFKVRTYVTNDPQFFLSRTKKDAITIQGLRYASRWKVQRIFAGDYDRSIYLIPLEERQRRLMTIDWISDASVARVWPDRVMIRVHERQPVAFVNLRRGARLIDAQGRLLEIPPQSNFTFPVLSGVGDDDTDAHYLEHVTTFLRVQDELGSAAKDISEIDTADQENIRLITQKDSRAITLLMGEGNFARRYEIFAKHFDEVIKRYPKSRIFDMRLEDRFSVKE